MEKVLGIFFRVWVWGGYYSGCRWINSLVYMELDVNGCVGMTEIKFGEKV